MNVQPGSTQTVVEYYVLKQGRTEGPFTEAEVVDQLSTGRFTSEDLGQAGDARHWTPLRRLFEKNPRPIIRERLPAAGAGTKPTTAEPAPAQSFGAEILRVWGQTMAGVQGLFVRYPFETGVFCALLGCALLLLSYARIFIVGPALAGGLLGGGITMLRGRVLAGVALCVASVFLPALIWALFLWAGQWVALPR